MRLPADETREKPFGLVLCATALCTIFLASCGGSPQSYITRGNRFYDSGKFVDAEIQYQKALQKSPDLGEAHYRLGLTELKQNNPVKAYQELRRASDLMPDNNEVAAHLGQLALNIYFADSRHPRELYQQASRAATQLLARDQKSFDGNMLQGGVALADKNAAEAVEYFRKAVQIKPGDMGAQLNVAQALVQDNQAPAAADTAREIIRKDKTFGPAYDFLFTQYRSSGKTEDAENVLKLKVSNNPTQAAFILELARYYAAIQKQPEMAATVQKLLENASAFPDGRMMVADFYASINKPEEALRYYNDGLQAAKAKNQLVWRKKMARILFALRKWPEALTQVDAILKETPDDDESRQARAQIWLAEGKPENLDPAIAELRAQLQKNKQSPILHFQLGNALARKGDQANAEREWAASAQQNARYLPPRYALVQLNLQRGSSQAALQIAEQIVAIAPRDAQARLVYATCLTSAGQYQRARGELDRLAAQFPQAGQIRFRQGVLAIAEKKFAEAEDIFRKLEAAAPGDHPEVSAGLAEAYVGQNESAKAIQMVENELKSNPNSQMLHLVLARLAMSSGKPDLAVEQYKQMATRAPNSVDIQVSLASAYIAAGNANSAVGILEKTVQAQPKSAAASLALARALVSAGRANDAKVRYRDVLTLQPENPNALNDLAYLMADSGENLDQALAYAQQGMKLAVQPGLKNSLSDTLGWIYFKKKMYDAAQQTFEIQVRNNPHNATYLYHLGATFYEKGDKKNARAELEAALAAKPGPSQESSIHELLSRL